MIDERDRLRDALALADEQHIIISVKLERFRDALASAAIDRVREEFQGLAAYLRIHFEAEQEVMERLAYPGWEAHAAKHRRFEAEVAALGERLDGAEEGEAATLEKWLSGHERTADGDLIEFVRLRLQDLDA